ncbi:MAG: molybdenum cofactor guanylyltransferase MobA [Granulosicoccus sp.]
MKCEKSRVGAVILAGGLARRMGGQDKGLVMLAGKPMASYALETVVPLVRQCVINANRNAEAYAALAPESVKVIADARSGHLGPLAGLSAAIAYLDTEYVLMCPCDSPFMQAGLVESLANRIQQHDADIAVAHDGQRLQPVFCIIHRRVQHSLDEFLDNGERKIDRWFLSHKLVEVDAGDYLDSFRNINTEEELAIAEKDLQS